MNRMFATKRWIFKKWLLTEIKLEKCIYEDWNHSFAYLKHECSKPNFLVRRVIKRNLIDPLKMINNVLAKRNLRREYFVSTFLYLFV